ncbi:FecR family protein [Occallatibacter savannae]|uniref:FecR family protein n=1 Tax=Occallatibacter savannae TaxID=1002691 RepID=UPI000D69615B|nr:FecR family protein [Occallatibacter savannae]
MKRFGKVRFNPQGAALGCALLLLFAIPGFGQDDQPDPPQQPHPDMRAARLSYVQGSVQLTQGSQIIADPAPVNTPVFEGTVVSTREDGQAELQFDDGSVARLSPNSSLQISLLRQENGGGKAEVLLTSGLGYFELSGNAANQMVARFGDSTVKASGFTVIRVNLDNPPGEVAVFTGNAHLDRGNLSLDLHGGQTVALSGTDPNQYNLAENIEPDSWDSWNADRDQDLSAQESARTAATSNQPGSSNPAWSDLDANGNWYDVPGQGYVWSPYEAANANWDPYGCGNWVYTPQFGYIWVSCESWGYMPYMAGYWNFYDGFGWGWTPGYGYPWWYSGGWGWNIGNRPPRYSPPHRPKHGPVGPVEPIRRGGGFYQQNPVIAVNRIPGAPVATPAHPIGRAATIAGSLVEPVRPLAPRPVYNHTGETASGRSALGYAGSSVGGKTGYNPWANSPGTQQRSNGWTMPAAGNRPSAGGTYRAPVATPYSGGAYRGPVTSPYAGAGGTYHPPAASPYSGGSRPSSPAPAPRSVGGGGAPAAHVSSGGGGGGHPAAPSHK